MFSGCPSAVTYVRARSCVPGRRLLHCESKKQDIKLLPTTSPNINRFPNNFFSLAGSVVNLQHNSFLNIPPRLKHVATLLCEI